MKLKFPKYKLVFDYDKKSWRIKTYFLSSEVFKYSLIAYLILLLLETIQEGFVSFFFNLNILLAIVIISGILMALTHEEELEEKQVTHKIQKKDILYITILSVGSAFLVCFKTYDLGIISFVLAGMVGVIIILLSIFLYTNPT